jgi:hypothetical protein
VAPLSAQSLADVARQEEARRRSIQKPARIYTNNDLGDPPLMPAAEPVSQPPAAPETGPPAVASPNKPSEAADTTKTAPEKGQAYWAGRKKELLDRLDRDQTFRDALQSRINALTTDFASRDDPVQRSVLERDRQKAVDELDRLNKAIESDRKAIADLDEEARRANVPPGWLR